MEVVKTWSVEDDENCKFAYFQYSHKCLENRPYILSIEHKEPPYQTLI